MANSEDMQAIITHPVIQAATVEVTAIREEDLPIEPHT